MIHIHVKGYLHYKTVTFKGVQSQTQFKFFLQKSYISYHPTTSKSVATL